MNRESYEHFPSALNPKPLTLNIGSPGPKLPKPSLVGSPGLLPGKLFPRALGQALLARNPQPPNPAGCGGLQPKWGRWELLVGLDPLDQVPFAAEQLTGSHPMLPNSAAAFVADRMAFGWLSGTLASKKRATPQQDGNNREERWAW